MGNRVDRSLLKALALVPFGFGGVLLLSGCMSTTAAPPDATPPPPPKKECDTFSRGPEIHFVDEKSYSTLSYLWSSDQQMANIGNWQPRARVYVGAAKELYQPMCEGSKEAAKPEVTSYVNAVKAFFAKHYEKQADAAENSILVLIAGMAPTSVDQATIDGALDALATVTVADPKVADQKKEFAKVLKAGYLFNKAADKADKTVRFKGPRIPCALSQAEKGAVAKDLTKAEAMLKTANKDALNDRQREFVTVLEGAISRLRALPKCKGKEKDEPAVKPNYRR